MTFLMIRQKIEDYNKWKVVYDEHETTRKSFGVKERYVLRNIDDMNEVTILFEIADLAKSQEFIESADLREAMKKAGVLGKPEFYFFRG